MLSYFDNNATTRVAPEAADAVGECLREYWGNPSSPHGFGSRVGRLMDEARSGVAELMGVSPREVVFTSGGTESINAAIASAVRMQPGKRHVVTSAVEHSAVMNCCRQLERRGYRVTWLPVDGEGRLEAAQVEESIGEETALVSVMHANNETGVIFPVEEIAAVCRRRKAWLHVDAVQAAGKMPIELGRWGVDMASVSGHKLHGPKGTGALYIRSGIPFEPWVVGGHQERGRRGGTENVAGIVGFGRAARLALERLPAMAARDRGMRDEIERRIRESVAGVARNGAREPRLPNTVNLSFAGVDSEAMVMMLDEAGICVSSGSACTTGSTAPSHVLTAMGISAERARSSLRLSLSVETTEAEVEHLMRHLPRIVEKLRDWSPARWAERAAAGSWAGGGAR